MLNVPLGVRSQIGYLPESAPSYSEMTVNEFLAFIAEVRGFAGKDRDASVDRAVDRTALKEVRNQIIETLSKGYRQRVCFAQALLHDPPVLILDEPTDGLDPNQKHEMRQVIRQMGQEKTIILSTHILEEMEAVCSRAIIIAHGKLLKDGTPDELAALSPLHNSVTIKTAAPLDADILEKMKAIPGVAGLNKDQDGQPGAVYQLKAKQQEPILAEVTRFLENSKIKFEQLFSERGRMDEVFRKITQDSAK
ncbi:MAG: ATP-binding cassette domain-containing protein, partial [Deltaproteobacteria bacterium]|nr:ATP-binding cassette domain-containing protein [Deltaproteobacteria bacterium]